MWIQSEGIVLSTIPFQGHHRILKILTKDHGLLSFIAKHIHSKKKNWQMITSPFSQVELVYQPKGELYSVKDASLIDAHLYLRSDYQKMQAAGKIVQTILQTHLPEKSFLLVYLLFEKYLKKISEFDHPDILVYSFLLKYLRIEGLLDLKPTCSSCTKPPEYIDQGESSCRFHVKDKSSFFTKEEIDQLVILCFSKQFSHLKELDLSTDLKEKIENLFLERVS